MFANPALLFDRHACLNLHPGYFVLESLFVGVVLLNFSSLGNIDPNLASEQDIEMFDETWNVMDPNANGSIAAEKFPELLMRLERPLRPLELPSGTPTPGTLAKANKHADHVPTRSKTLPGSDSDPLLRPELAACACAGTPLPSPSGAHLFTLARNAFPFVRTPTCAQAHH